MQRLFAFLLSALAHIAALPGQIRKLLAPLTSYAKKAAQLLASAADTFENHPALISVGITGLFFLLAGASLFYAFGLPVSNGILMGLLLAVPPAWRQWMQGDRAAMKAAEWLNLALLFVISLSVAVLILLPLLDGQSPSLTQNLPLLLSAAVLYMLYLILNRSAITYSNPSLVKKLALQFSGPPMVMALVMSVTISAFLLLLLHNLRLDNDSWSFYSDKFLDRGIIPPITVILFFWGLLMLFGKFWVLIRERRWLLTGNDRSQLMQAYQMHRLEQPNSTADLWLDLIWKKAAEFYVVPRYINWAIPILGFIGTVLGISLAAEGIQRIIGKQEELTQLSSDLGQAISPLGIAFDTTLIALSLSVALTLAQTLLQRWEDSLLMDYESRIRQGEPAGDS